MIKKYIYFLSELTPTVIDSQVILPLRDLSNNGFVFDLFVFGGFKSSIYNRHYLKRKLHEIRTYLDASKIIYIPIPARNSHIGRIITCLVASLFLLRYFIKSEIVICHSRGHDSALLASYIKQIFSNFYYVFDVRGDIASEVRVNSKISKNQKEWKLSNMYAKIKKLEMRAIKHSSQIICVSRKQLLNFEKEYTDHLNKIHVIPCLASEKVFFFKESLRNTVRAALNIENRIVIVYAGALAAQWHIPEIIFDLFRDWMQRNSNIHFLIVTPDVKIASKLAEVNSLSEKDITIISANHSDVAQYLMAGDVGLLLRKNDPLNQVASPTKFAEYVLTGLPVLASNSIGDLEEHIKQYGFGVSVHSLDYELIWEKLEELLKIDSSGKSRETRAESAKTIYSAENAVDLRMKIYLKAVENG